MSTYNIYHNFFIKASTNKVFEAFSSPDHLINWWPLKCSGEPTLGATYNFNFTDEYNWYGEVSKLEVGRSFYIKMTDSDKDWNPTTFGFEIEAGVVQTIVRFSHTGWKTCNDEFKNSSFCWALLLQGLKEYVEEGIVVEFEDRA